jgi:hypothetical protein
MSQCVERAVFGFELSDIQLQLENIHYVASALDDRVLDVPIYNVRM